MQDGRISHLDHVFLRGSRIRFMIIPDMLKNAPMFKRIDPKHKVGSACWLKDCTACPLAHVPRCAQAKSISIQNCQQLRLDRTKSRCGGCSPADATKYVLCEQAKNVATGVGGRGRAVAARAKAKAAAGAAGGPGPGRGRGM
jgi:hypothetical protein